jgi:hypothetical protein
MITEIEKIIAKLEASRNELKKAEQEMANGQRSVMTDPQPAR